MIKHGLKKCWKCKTYKSPRDFFRNTYKPDGLQDECKKCKAAYLKTYYKSHRQYYIKFCARCDNLCHKTSTFCSKCSHELNGMKAKERYEP